MANTVAGFDEHMLSGDEPGRFDLDRDGLPDAISISCSSSLPGQEADPCYIDVHTSREGTYTFTAWQAFAIRIRQRPLIVGSPSTGNQRQRKLALYQLGARESHAICEIPMAGR